MQLIGSEIAGGKEVCAGAGGSQLGWGTVLHCIEACVESTRGNNTACLQRKGNCSPAKQSNGEAGELELADDGSFLSSIKVALPLTKTLCPAWMQSQNDGSLLQNIYRLIKRHDTKDKDRQGDDIFIWMWEEKCSSPCQACWKLCRQMVYFVLSLLLVKL